MASESNHRLIVIKETIKISDTVELTKNEIKTLNKIRNWLTDNISNLELDTVEVGFPSGVKITLKNKKN